jgi:hypothetical protein
LQRKLTSCGDVKARSAVLKLKKRHVERVTRLPTKRMATACWAFIVAKRASLQAAPLLDFGALRVTNRTISQQLIHKALWTPWGYSRRPLFRAKTVDSHPC